MESELLGSIWRWGLSPYKDQSGPTQQMREHRDGGPRKRGLKAEGTRDRWWKWGKERWRRERKWGMDGAADQREPLVCLALPLKKSQENRLGVLFSPGEARAHTHTTHTHTFHLTTVPPPRHTNIKLTNFYAAPAADLPGPEQIRSVLKSSSLSEWEETQSHNDSLCAAV